MSLRGAIKKEQQNKKNQRTFTIPEKLQVIPSAPKSIVMPSTPSDVWGSYQRGAFIYETSFAECDNFFSAALRWHRAEQSQSINCHEVIKGAKSFAFFSSTRAWVRVTRAFRLKLRWWFGILLRAWACFCCPLRLNLCFPFGSELRLRVACVFFEIA